MPQRASNFQVNCCLKVHNPHLKLLSPISGYGRNKDAQKLGQLGLSVSIYFSS